MNIDKNRLTIPIYLNTKIVFDMLATIEDGFSEVKNVQTSNNKRGEENIEANIGSSNLFAFLNVGIRGDSSKSNSSDEIITEERTHTTVSLFQKLKTILEEQQYIKRDFKDIDIGDFVEVKGTLRENPLIEFLSGFKEVMNLSVLFSDNKQNGKSKKQEVMENNKLNSQIEGLINGLREDGKKDIICESDLMKIILPTDENYFLNNSMKEITDGNYKILGKVITLCKDEGEISLLRNTVFSKLRLDKLMNLQELFNDDSIRPFLGDEGIQTAIEAPVMMIIPIAIYV